MTSPRNYVLKIPEIAEMANRLEKGLGRSLTAEERKFFILAEQAYEEDEKARETMVGEGEAA